MERNEGLENVAHWQNAYFDTGEGGSTNPVQQSQWLAAAAVAEELDSTFTGVLTLRGYFSSVSLLCFLFYFMENAKGSKGKEE